MGLAPETITREKGMLRIGGRSGIEQFASFSSHWVFVGSGLILVVGFLLLKAKLWV